MKWGFLICLNLCLCAGVQAKSIAMFYGEHLPVNELSLYSRVVVQPDQTTQSQLDQLFAYKVQVLAYLSLGEGHNVDIDASSATVLAKNLSWNSLVIDLTDIKWQRYVLENAEALLSQGYQGFFLDTLDSYYLAELDDHAREAQQKALANIIKKLKGLGAKVIIQNRGFELLDATNKVVDAIAAESLVAGYNASQDSYYLVNQADQEWLLGQFNKASKLGLETIAIDYTKDHQQRAAIADEIQALGITPWVSDGHLTQLGTGDLRPVPRRVLIAYDSREEIYSESVAHRLFVPHLEYLGYMPEYVDIAEGNWPQADPALYAGALFYLSSSQYSQTLLAALADWQGLIPLLFLNDLPANDVFLQRLGMKLTDVDNHAKATFLAEEQWAYEADINDIPYWLRPETAIENLDPANHVQLKVDDGQQQAAVAIIAPWGGVILQPALFLSLPEGQRQWLYDPVKLLHEGLQLAHLPIADITTENGRRILTSHIDGDGFVARAKFPGNPMSAEVMLKQVIDYYKLPITVSVIEGEVGPTGLYPNESKEAEALARTIFAKPYVEVASHSYSHPFYWRNTSDINSLDYGYHLPIKDYQLSIEREVVGSIEYINQHLTTAEKPVALMLWTGDAMPDKQAIAYTKKMGVSNVNGGNTKLVYGQASLTNLWPIGRPLQDGIQVYAPIMNENVYTELWQGAHFGYQRVLETYSLTDQPRRYKPISVYYHFYSAEDPAGILALRRVYDGVVAQQVFPMYLSEYARKAEEFYHYGLAKTAQGEWFMKLNEVNTIRFHQDMGKPVIDASNQIKGYSLYNDSVYVHLNKNDVRFTLSDQATSSGYLISSNAALDKWTSTRKNDQVKIQFVANSFLPFELILSHPGQCRLLYNGNEYLSKGANERHEFTMTDAVNNQAMVISCK